MSEDEIAGVAIHDLGLFGAGDEIEQLFGPFGGFCYWLSGVWTQGCGDLNDVLECGTEPAELRFHIWSFYAALRGAIGMSSSRLIVSIWDGSNPRL